MPASLINWLSEHILELFGALTGLAYIVLSIRQNIFLWPLGILNALVYLLVFLLSSLYLNMALQAYYLFVGIYGWIHWKQRDKEESFPVMVLTTTSILWILPVVFALCAPLYWLLEHHSDSSAPFLDALTSSLSMIATWLLVRKVLENWFIWMGVNLIYIYMFATLSLYATAFLYLIWAAMAVAGYIAWKKQVQKDKMSNPSNPKPI